MLDEAVATLNAKDAKQDGTITTALIITCVAMAGCLVMAVVFVVDKCKRT